MCRTCGANPAPAASANRLPTPICSEVEKSQTEICDFSRLGTHNGGHPSLKDDCCKCRSNVGLEGCGPLQPRNHCSSGRFSPNKTSASEVEIGLSECE